MPGRLEFEHEYDNEAEHLVKDIAFYEGDGEDDIGKLCVCAIVFQVTYITRIETYFIGDL
jgi:hypothetical protein